MTADESQPRLFDPGEDRLLCDAMLGKLVTYLRMCGYDTAYVESEADAAAILATTDPVDATTEPRDATPDDRDATPDGRDVLPDDRDAAIREWAEAESLTLLTRDRQLGTTTDGAILLSARHVDDQLAELARAGFTLRLPDRPRRCATCNAALETVGPDDPVPDYAPAPDATEVWRCPDCGQHYWRGSHWDDVAATLDGVGRS